jgi:hypothetical protein
VEVDIHYLGRFSLVFYHLAVNLTLIKCHLKVLKRREGSARRFVHNSRIFIRRGLEVDIHYLSRLSLVFHHLAVNLTLIQSHLKVMKRLEGSAWRFP